MDNFDPTNSTDVEALKQYYMAQSEAQNYVSLDSLTIGIYITFGAIILACLVLTIISLWRLLKKAGEKPWKSLIPIYNIYVICKICNRKKCFWAWLILSVIASIMPTLIEYNDGDIISLICSIILIGLETAVFVFLIFIFNGISHAFSHKKGFTVGLIFLNTIFICILGLGKSKYSPEAVFDKTNK